MLKHVQTNICRRLIQVETSSRRECIRRQSRQRACLYSIRNTYTRSQDLYHGTLCASTAAAALFDLLGGVLACVSPAPKGNLSPSSLLTGSALHSPMVTLTPDLSAATARPGAGTCQKALSCITPCLIDPPTTSPTGSTMMCIYPQTVHRSEPYAVGDEDDSSNSVSP